MNWFRRALNTGYVGARACVERRVPFWPAERVERLQRFRVRSIIRHAYEAVPYYRDVMQQQGLRPENFRTAADLTLLPLLDDLTVRTRPELFASERYDDNSRITAYTSGTTSHVQKKIYWDYGALLDRLAYAERDRAVMNALLDQGWGQCQLYIFPQDSMALTVRAFWDQATLTPRRLAERHFLSPDLPLEEILERLNAIKPGVVFSYGSFADLFFRWLSDQRREIAAPRVWMYGADMLSAGGRELMEKQFGCIVYSTYQAGETGRIGYECERRDGFHLNIDSVAVRLVNEDGGATEPGQTGEVVISNLYNRAMVLLNYRLGDLAAIDAVPCPCGRSLPLLKHFEGRRTETVQLANGRTVPAVIFEVSFKKELHETIQAQFVQLAAHRILWRLVPCSGTDREALRTQMMAKSLAIFGQDGEVDVSVEFVERIPNARGGKFRPSFMASQNREGSGASLKNGSRGR